MCRNPCILAHQSHAISVSSTPFLARYSRVVLILARLLLEYYSRKPLEYSNLRSLARPKIHILLDFKHFVKFNPGT